MAQRWDYDIESLAARGGRLLNSVDAIQRRLMLTIDGEEHSVEEWARRASAQGVDITPKDIIRRFCQLHRDAHDSVFTPIDRRNGTPPASEEELTGLLTAWREHQRRQGGTEE